MKYFIVIIEACWVFCKLFVKESKIILTMIDL